MRPRWGVKLPPLPVPAPLLPPPAKKTLTAKKPLIQCLLPGLPLLSPLFLLQVLLETLQVVQKPPPQAPQAARIAPPPKLHPLRTGTPLLPQWLLLPRPRSLRSRSWPGRREKGPPNRRRSISPLAWQRVTWRGRIL